jgi:serine/threonine protein kinase
MATGSLGSSAGGPAPVAPPPAPAAAPKKRSASVHSLAQGTRLHEFELTDHIGEGGFSIVYRAWDHSLERVVALKEYMPGSLATRDEDTRVHVRNESMQATFDAGLRSFVNESKLLASFDHPSLVKVYRFWEANGTAYMVMPFYEGLTLKDTVRTLPGRPGQDWILEVLAPLAEALTYIHQRQCFHRDIAPDNVLMLADTGRPLLLDFGAARRTARWARSRP